MTYPFKPESIEDLRDNFDIEEYDDWHECILDLTSKLRDIGENPASMECPFENKLYRVTVEMIEKDLGDYNKPM